MSFKKDKFCVIKKAVSKELVEFLFNYFIIQKQVYDTCRQTRYFSPFETILGYYEGKNDQIPNTYSQYSNIAFETLLLKLQPLMEKETNLKLNPAYTYARVYKKGDVLKKHKDRVSCEISTTINLGGDKWPIYLKNSKKEFKVDLSPGDMLIYRGCELEHWRNAFKGKECAQVFLHYTNAKNKKMFDGRKHLGLPNYFKDKNGL
mgnify:CR=1 FL=1